jgi:hypothetical protein
MVEHQHTCARFTLLSLVSAMRIEEDCDPHTIEESFIAESPKFLSDICRVGKNYAAAQGLKLAGGLRRMVGVDVGEQ